MVIILIDLTANNQYVEYVSDVIDINNGFNTINIGDILLVVPQVVTWTFEINSNDNILAGLIISEDPKVKIYDNR